MNRLRSHKFKLNNTIDSVQSNSNSNNGYGLLNKITKRYSTFSSKITRRHENGNDGRVGRKGSSPQKIVSGSYDMTGIHSEDHRLEIGAPILISTTTLDTDRFDISESRLKQIGGGIAINSSTLPKNTSANQLSSSPQMPSSESENEVFVDALSTPPLISEEIMLSQNEEQQFEIIETPKKRLSALNAEEMLAQIPRSKSSAMFDGTDEIDSIQQQQQQQKHNPMLNYYETSKITSNGDSNMNKKSHSKSAQNLHRAELKVFLQKAPSNMELDIKMPTVDFQNSQDLPKLLSFFGASKSSFAPTDKEEEHENLYADKKKSTQPLNIQRNLQTNIKCASNSSLTAEQQDKVAVYLTQQHQHFKSVDSLELHSGQGQRRSVIFSSSSTLNQQHGSKNSLTMSQNSNLDDFDLKSVSFQSLNAQSLFVSIDELNEITQQIHESEEFNREIDLEYCQHRDNLKPSERRITLLKNKNSCLIKFNNNKEKLKKGWNGVRNWIGEESTKIKEVVQKQSNLQKVGGSGGVGTSSSKLNLSHTDSQNSPFMHGGSVLKLRNNCCENSITDIDLKKTVDIDIDAITEKRLSITKINRTEDNFGTSCEKIEKETCGAAIIKELDTSFIVQRLQDDDESPIIKRAKREGQNGFEELRRYIKQGGDFGKEVILILQERVDSELLYSKSLSKMASKLNKACRELPGSIAEAWRSVATEMENRSDIHRQLSASLTDEIVKPLKAIVDSHHKTRKSVENNVDKAARVLTEWRVSEAKAKKASHTAARENEKLQDAMLDVRIQKSPSIALLHQGSNKLAAEKEIKSAEKDCAKLDNKRKKAEEAVKRADVEYYTLCVRAERARVDWEMSVLRGSSLLQNIENQRLINMKNFISNYNRLTKNMHPILNSLVQGLQPHIDACNVAKDMQVVRNIRRASEGPSEQLLPDFYCEHTTLAMNRERRKHALIKLLQLVKTDLERERRSRSGLKGLSQSLNNQENQNITDKLYHIRSMLTYLEGARFKLHSALLELDHKPRTTHPLAEHIQITRDRTGLQQSVLKVPLWLKNNDKVNSSVNSVDESIRANVNDYDHALQSNTFSNVSSIDLSGENNSIAFKNFSRSKSNIETFSTNTQICLNSINDNKVSNPVMKSKTLQQQQSQQQPQQQQTAKTISTKLNDPYSDRGQADGGSNQQDSDFDEFSSQDEDDEQTLNSTTTTTRREHKEIITSSQLFANSHHYQNTVEIQEELFNSHQQNNSNNNNISPNSGNKKSVVLSKCKALYSYTPKLYDELELNPGDIIEIHAKQEDGWWLGALNNQIGIFPATYVEEFA